MSLPTPISGEGIISAFRVLGMGMAAKLSGVMAAWPGMAVPGVAPADNGDGRCVVYQPFQADMDARFPVGLTVPGERTVFVVES